MREIDEPLRAAAVLDDCDAVKLRDDLGRIQDVRDRIGRSWPQLRQFEQKSPLFSVQAPSVSAASDSAPPRAMG